jgi:hypothetical protein
MADNPKPIKVVGLPFMRKLRQEQILKEVQAARPKDEVRLKPKER